MPFLWHACGCGSSVRGLTASLWAFEPIQRLAGATLLIFANKQDVAGALSVAEIRDVSRIFVPLWSGSSPSCRLACETDTRRPFFPSPLGASATRDQESPMDDPALLGRHWREPRRRAGLDRQGRCESVSLALFLFTEGHISCPSVA